MKKMYLTALAVAILIIGGVYGFNALTGEEEANLDTNDVSEVVPLDEEEVTNAEEQTSVSEPEQSEEEAVATAGQYLEYSDENLAATKDTKQILFFHADWCPTCRAFEQLVNEEGVPEGVTILKVDYDSNPDLRQQYGIPYQSYLAFVDNEGELVDSWYTPETQSLNDVADRVGA